MGRKLLRSYMAVPPAASPLQSRYHTCAFSLKTVLDTSITDGPHMFGLADQETVCVVSLPLREITMTQAERMR